MAEEISNRTLAILLVVAIAISLGGTIVSLNRLAQVRSPFFTGLATGIGTASVNITSQASIIFNTSAIDFGNGWVNTTSGEDTCRMDAIETGNPESSSSIACVDDWADANSNWGALIIENDGNTNLTVEVETDGAFAEFLGVGGGFWFMANESEVGSCNASASLNSSTDDEWFEWPAGDDKTGICNYLDFNDNRDQMWLHLRVNISYLSQYIGTGTRTSNITATGTTAIP